MPPSRAEGKLNPISLELQRSSPTELNINTETTVPDLDEIKRAPASAGILDSIAARWSPRAFSDRPVSSEVLHKIFTAASWAASSTNEQPWRFFFGRNGDSTFVKILDSMAEANQAWAKHAPVLLLSVGKSTFSPGPYTGRHNPYALHDTGAASAFLALQTSALGLYAHGIGGFDHDKARAHFRIPEEFEIGACWAIGYLGDPDTLPEPLKQRELAPRTRKPVAEFVFAEWEVPAKL